MYKMKEIIIELKNGNSIRSSSETFEAGDYVQVCDPEGNEIAYWESGEWQEEPENVMGAILMAASGKTIK